IQALYLISRRYSTEVATAQQIGDIMDIIRSSGNRGTEILLGNIPIFQIIMVQQHCLVQDLDGFGIKKIDRLLPISIFYDHWGQFGTAFDQRPKIIPFAVFVPLMQSALYIGTFFFSIGHWSLNSDFVLQSKAI